MLNWIATRDEYLSAIAPPPILPIALAPQQHAQREGQRSWESTPVSGHIQRQMLLNSGKGVRGRKNRLNPKIQNIGVLITSLALLKLCRGALAGALREPRTKIRVATNGIAISTANATNAYDMLNVSISFRVTFGARKPATPTPALITPTARPRFG